MQNTTHIDETSTKGQTNGEKHRNLWQGFGWWQSRKGRANGGMAKFHDEPSAKRACCVHEIR